MRLINSDGQIVDAKVDGSSTGGGSGSASNSGVHFKDGVLSVIALVLACMSLMGTMWAIDKAGRAEQRADLAELEVESFKNVLHSRGMPTATHLDGEKP